MSPSRAAGRPGGSAVPDEGSSPALRVNAHVAIPRSELTTRASRAGGAGGQHVNTSSTRIEVTWRPGASAALTGAQRARVLERLATKLDGEGTLRVVNAETRSQLQNRVRAETRLAELVRAALVVPRVRVATKPTRSSRERRLETKRKRSNRKQDRRLRSDD